MGKLKQVSGVTKTIATKRKSKQSRGKPDLTLDQRIRLAAFREMMKWKDEQWAKKTPKQQQEEIAAWERMKKSMNADRAGYRQLFVDE
jgi:hypothetical protein